MHNEARKPGGLRALRIASCILLKCAAWWKWLAMSLVSSVASTLTKVNRMRQPMACARHAGARTSIRVPAAVQQRSDHLPNVKSMA